MNLQDDYKLTELKDRLMSNTYEFTQKDKILIINNIITMNRMLGDLILNLMPTKGEF